MNEWRNKQMNFIYKGLRIGSAECNMFESLCCQYSFKFLCFLLRRLISISLFSLLLWMGIDVKTVVWYRLRHPQFSTDLLTYVCLNHVRNTPEACRGFLKYFLQASVKYLCSEINTGLRYVIVVAAKIGKLYVNQTKSAKCILSFPSISCLLVAI